MSNRTVRLGGVWADGAADVPGGGNPTTGVTYANSDLTLQELHDGWPYKTVVDSSKSNEVLRRLTFLMDQLESYGNLKFCAATTYAYGSKCLGNDGQTYVSMADNNINRDPTTDTEEYWILETQLMLAGLPRTGMISYLAGNNSAPSGYMICDGASYSRTTFHRLFSVIGTTYGSDTIDTFKVPDLRGVFLRGYDLGLGRDPGRAFGSLQGDQNRQHAHLLAAGELNGDAWSAADGVKVTALQHINAGDNANGDASFRLMGTGTTPNVGLSGNSPFEGTSVGAVESRPVNVAMLAVIKW